MSICYIVGAGDFYGELCPKPGDLVIAADGGLDTLRRIGVKPDLLIGDLDSLEGGEANDLTTLRHPVEKDETDTYLAYLEGVRRGYTDFLIYGGVGGRLDHTFANISLLIYGKRRGHSLSLIDRGMKISALKNESVTISPSVCRGFSLLAFDGEARGVTIRGAKYDVEGVTLTPEFPLGVSNSLAGSSCEITVSDGELILMMSE